MKNINDFIGGWFVGDFSPSLFKTNQFEVAYKKYKAGDFEKKHLHKIAIEFTLIIEGEVMMNNVKYSEGDIITIKPNESTDFRAITNTKTVVVKTPSISNDKYILDND